MANRKKSSSEVKVFGEILKKHRIAQKYSLRELASRCDVSASHLNRLEKDHVSATYEVISRIAETLGINPSEFFPGQGGFKPSYRTEFGPILESRAVQVMVKKLATLDPYAQKAISVATTHWIELLKRGLHPVKGKEGIYRINEAFVEELEGLKRYMSP